MGANSVVGSPRVTVGIPIYNAAATLPLTLRSVFAQTFTDWELILVDDGSTDGSVEIMRAVLDRRVRVFVDGANKTQGPRHNDIARLARAPLVARLDSDDLMHPDRLARQVRYMDDHPEVDVVGSAMYSMDAGHYIRGRRSSSHPPRSEFEAGIRAALANPTVTGRTTWFLENPDDETSESRRCEDAELWFRTYGRSTTHSLDEPLLFYLEDSENAIRKLRSSNRGMLRIMFAGHGGVRRKPLSVRLAVATVICVKMAAYELCWLLGARRYLIDRRNRPLDPAEEKTAYAALEQVMAQSVPGLSQPDRTKVE